MSFDPPARPVTPVLPLEQQESLQLDAVTESAWVDVVHQMEAVYSDLIKYQVEIEQKNEELEETQNFVSSVLAAMTDVLIVTDPVGRIQQVNGALETLTGQSGDDLKGRPFAELFSAESLTLIDEYRRQNRRPAFQDVEVQLCGTEGEVPLAMNCSIRQDSRGRILGMVLIGRPIGELRRAYDQLNTSHAQLKQAQQQLVSSEKMASLGRLVAGVAHELNNPISFVYGNVHALQAYSARLQQYLDALHSDQPPETLAELRASLRIDKLLSDLPSLLDGTMEGAERVRDIVMDLRQFSSGQKVHRTEFDLVHVVQTAVHWVTRDARVKVRLGYDMPTKLMIPGHPGQIQQVIINLVQNAVDVLLNVASPRIDLAVTLGPGCACFSLTDNGPGIAPENLSRVFEPFFTTKPIGEGTGLGLSLSYGLVAEHGGTLQVENRPEGGCRFLLELPRGEGQQSL